MHGLPASPALSPTVGKQSHCYLCMLKDKSALATLKWWASLLLRVHLLLLKAEWVCSGMCLFFWPNYCISIIIILIIFYIFIIFFLQGGTSPAENQGGASLQTWHGGGEGLNPSQQRRPVSLGKALSISLSSKLCCTASLLYPNS